MDDFTPAATLAINTEGQRDALAAAAKDLVELEVGSLLEAEGMPGSSSADLAVEHTYVDDAEALAERIDAGGSVCLVPGRLVRELWTCLGDALEDVARDASDELTDPDGRAALAVRAQDLMALLAGLAPAVA